MSEEIVRDRLVEVHDRLLSFMPKVRRGYRPLERLFLTILSQYTNDNLAERALSALMEGLSSPEDVRRLSLEEVERRVRVAGLSRQKALAIKEAADRFDEGLSSLKTMPPDEAKSVLTSIRGIGGKTARVVLNFCFDMPFFPVDTHVYRVLKRLGIVPVTSSRDRVSDFVEKVLRDKGGDFLRELHLSLILLGRRICRPKKPACDLCPLKDMCSYGRG